MLVQVAPPSRKWHRWALLLLVARVVQVEQALADALLQVQGVLHGLEAALLLSGLGHPDVEEGDAAAVPVQQEHQALGPLAVLVGAQQELGDKSAVTLVVVQGAGPGQARKTVEL